MAYQLWDPAAPQASHTCDAVIAASTTQIAWTPPCAARCRVQAVNPATGRQVTADLPEGRSAASAAFGPDGRFLAVEVSYSNEAACRPGAARLAVAGVRPVRSPASLVIGQYAR